MRTGTAPGSEAAVFNDLLAPLTEDAKVEAKVFFQLLRGDAGAYQQGAGKKEGCIILAALF